jgi:predicted hydrolase (HD superfamily)
VSRFGSAVSRADIALGCEELGIDPAEHIQFCIDALAAQGAALGLVIASAS